MYAKIEPHRAHCVTYAILRNYKKKTAELKKKLAIKYKNLRKYKSSLIPKLYGASTLFPKGKSIDGSFESSHYVERTRDGSLLHPFQYVITPAAKELPHGQVYIP